VLSKSKRQIYVAAVIEPPGNSFFSIKTLNPSEKEMEMKFNFKGTPAGT